MAISTMTFARKSLDQPDERRPFVDKGEAAVVNVGGLTIMRARYEPGWKWSEHVKPIAGTESCEATHVGYVLSGRMRIRMASGEEAEAGPGDAVTVPANHDAWVVGDEPCEFVDFGPSVATYARG
jgi:quercetin dioxygenase-like cupin family protein